MAAAASSTAPCGLSARHGVAAGARGVRGEEVQVVPEGDEVIEVDWEIPLGGVGCSEEVGSRKEFVPTVTALPVCEVLDYPEKKEVVSYAGFVPLVTALPTDEVIDWEIPLGGVGCSEDVSEVLDYQEKVDVAQTVGFELNVTVGAPTDDEVPEKKEVVSYAGFVPLVTALPTDEGIDWEIPLGGVGFSEEPVSEVLDYPEKVDVAQTDGVELNVTVGTPTDEEAQTDGVELNVTVGTPTDEDVVGYAEVASVSRSEEVVVDGLGVGDLAEVMDGPLVGYSVFGRGGNVVTGTSMWGSDLLSAHGRAW